MIATTTTTLHPTAMGWPGTMPSRPGGNGALPASSAIKSAESPTTAPTERSMPPATITSPWPSAIKPRNAISRARFCRL